MKDNDTPQARAPGLKNVLAAHSGSLLSRRWLSLAIGLVVVAGAFQSPGHQHAEERRAYRLAEVTSLTDSHAKSRG